MGTNYYHDETPRCASCGHSDDRRHIGKSSAGWCFSLHVYPEDEIHDLPDWEVRWMTNSISDEYGDEVSPAQMSGIIRNRYWKQRPEASPIGYTSWTDFHACNHSEPGPRGLLRHQIGEHCVGHGEGTWDLIIGDFS